MACAWANSCPTGGAILAVKGDIEQAGAVRLKERTLQSEALLHAWHHTAVVITHGQAGLGGLRPKQNAPGVLAGNDLHGGLLQFELG